MPTRALLLLLTVSLTTLAAGPAKKPAPPKAHEHAAPPATQAPAEAAPIAPPNPVQQEMRVLTEAMKAILDAVANNTLAVIPPTLHRVHGAREVTERALASGSYKPPKNGDDVKGFITHDEAFHGELVKLLRAAQANDLKATTRQLGPILDGCTSCHQRYRF